MSIRRSQRLAGQAPDNSTDLAKLTSLRNTRRGLLAHLTRVANQVLMYLRDNDTPGASNLHNSLVETYLKFRAANTEYLAHETDKRKIQECKEAESREANRLSEIEKMIRSRLRTPNPQEDNSTETSLYDVGPSDIPDASFHQGSTTFVTAGSDGHSPANSDVPSLDSSDLLTSANLLTLQSSQSQVRFTPKPPSVPSITAKPRSSFRRFRQNASCDSLSTHSADTHSSLCNFRQTTTVDGPSTHSSGTIIVGNPNSYKLPKPPHLVFKPVDQFIDELVEGQETCLAGLSHPTTATSALRFEFETKALPTIELVKFNGDSAKWPDFVENFSRRVHYKLSFTDNDRMERLLSVLVGEAKKSVECIGTSGIFYATALKTLKRDFGNKTVVTHSKLKELFDKAQLPSNDRTALKRYHQHLKSTVTWLTMIGNISAIHSAEHLTRAVMRLPNDLRKAFYRTSKNYEETGMSLFKLESWLDSKLKEFYNPIADIIAQEERKDKDKRKDKIKDGRSNHLGAENVTKEKKALCYLCQEPHRLWLCDKFKQKPIPERRGDVRRLNLCFNCLSKGHSVKDCKCKTRCKECQRKHHTLLHDSNYTPRPPQDSTQTRDIETHFGKSKGTTYLQIIPVTISYGNTSIEVNALLDPGSDTTMISASLVDRLKLPIVENNLKVSISNVLTKKQTMNSKSVRFKLSSDDSEIQVDRAWVVERLNIKIKPYDVAIMKKRYKHLKNVPIPKRLNKDVEILIGADVPEALLHLDFLKGEHPNDPIAIRTLLGWTIFGGRSNEKEIQSNHISLEALDSKLERFWTQETYATIPNPDALLTREEKRAMNLLQSKTKLVNDRFEVGMLWKSDNVKLVNNRPLAVSRLLSTERRLERIPEIREIYSSKIDEYVKIGHVKELTKEESSKTSLRTNYIPHHFVLEPNKPGKIRIVWDASAKFKGTSLNDQLLKGPDLLNSLVAVLSKFRRGKVAVMSDVEKMFHQILVPVEDRDSLRFLWRKDPNDEISEYQILVHAFGKKDSPCCANWALKGCVNEIPNVPEGKTLRSLSPEKRAAVTKAVTEEFYMDDFLGSFDSTEEAVSTCFDLVKVTEERCFRLTKWISNDPKFLKTIPKEDLSPKIANLDFSQFPAERTLGVRWNPTEDVFFFNIPVKECRETKRGLLSFLCSIFDPLGFLAPYLVAPKLMLQTLWKEKVGWDDQVPDYVLKQFKQWKEGLLSLREISIPRWFKFAKVTGDEIELHVFSDASMKAYGAVAYFRTIHDEEINCSFIIGKSRLAPIKGSTTPRLELQAAVLASRIKKCVVVEMDLHMDKTFMWTDSKVVLSYIRNEDKRFSNYVMNRTNEIRNKTDIQNWCFVPGKLNVADIGTKCFGIRETKTWIEGPEFLKAKSVKQFEEPEEEEELMEIVTAHTEVKINESMNVISWERFSSWKKIRRCYAWILKLKQRWIEVKRNGKSSTNKDFLDVEDLNAVTNELSRISQEESQHSLDEKRISSLTPVIINNLVCVGGRIAKCDIPNQSKHQIILSNEHPISELVIRHFHELNCHCGRNATLALVREQFWILKGKSKVRKVLNRCFTCKRETIKTKHPMMAELPKDRLAVGSHPFEHVGIDYFGPITVKQGRRTRHREGTAKRYGALFTCMTTRALHLELAGDLSTDCFILALRRFRARRGNPRIIRSDNGTNFVGAEREIREALSKWNQKQIKDELSQYNIKWKFNPPVAPWMGGAMESMVKLTKKSLRSVIKDRIFTEEALYTLLLEVESTINSRPLTPLSDDINDFEALTPNHFLLGRASPNQPIIFNTEETSLKSKWKQVQSAFDGFWKRWAKEYLPTINERAKWRHPVRNVNEGDLVVIGEKNVPRYKWSLARVISVIISDDGITRIAKVKTPDGSIYTRPTGSLGLLEKRTSS